MVELDALNSIACGSTVRAGAVAVFHSLHVFTVLGILVVSPVWHVEQ